MNYYQRMSKRLGEMSDIQLKKELESYKFLYEETLKDINKIELEKLNFLVNARIQTTKMYDDDEDESYTWEYYSYTDENNETWKYETIDEMLEKVFEPVISDFKSNIDDYIEKIIRITNEMYRREL